MGNLNERLLKYSIFLLSRRDYSEKELRTKFKEKEYTQVDSNKIIEYLKENKYQSDERFARAYINSKISKIGLSKLKSKLIYEKGVSSDIIDEVTSEMDFDETENILRIIKTKYKNKDLKDQKERSKAFRYLASKGFSFDDINKAIKAE